MDEERTEERIEDVVEKPTVEETLENTFEETKEVRLEKSLGLDLEKLELEIRRGYREIKHADKEYRIYLPSIRDDEKIAKFKSKLSTEVLMDKDVRLKDEIIKSLKERGVWDQDKDKREKELRDRYSKCLGEFYLERAKSEPNKELLGDLRREKMELDIDLALLTETKSYFISSAAETRIEEKILLYKATLCIKNIDGTYIWNSYDEIEASEDKALVNILTSEAIYFWAGIEPSMFDFALE